MRGIRRSTLTNVQKKVRMLIQKSQYVIIFQKTTKMVTMGQDLTGRCSAAFAAIFWLKVK